MINIILIINNINISIVDMHAGLPLPRQKEFSEYTKKQNIIYNTGTQMQLLHKARKRRLTD